jgi:hypothetical protein
MDTSLKVTLGGIAAAIIAVLFILLSGQTEHTAVGGVASPDFNIGGMHFFSARTGSLNQATTSVLCALQSPAATSTLMEASVELSTGTSTVTSLFMAKGTAPAVTGATTLASTSVASGALKTLELNGTTTVGAYVFSPNTYFQVVQLGGGVLNQTGVCQALWQTTN